METFRHESLRARGGQALLALDALLRCGASVIGHNGEQTSLEFITMKLSCFAAVAATAVLTAGCASTAPPANDQTAQTRPGDANTYILHEPYIPPPPANPSKPPRLTVGVSDPDTQLILPWFLNDIINFVNYR
jgi:hypothetical protein